MSLSRRDTQTQVKHLILQQYMDDWAGIILNGLSRIAKSRQDQGLPFRVRLLYVDGFSHKGRYLGDSRDVLLRNTSDTPTWGSPILGIQALDRAREHVRRLHGFHMESATVLFEQNLQYFDELKRSLDLAGFGDRVDVNPPTVKTDDGRIVAIHGDFLAYVDRILELLAEPYTWSFVLLDPYGPTGIPYSLVSMIVAQRNTDVMINFPYQDLHKKQGILHRAQKSPADDALLQNHDLLFGTAEWRERCVAAYNQARPSERSYSIESELASLYVERLKDSDRSLSVKHIRLQFPDRMRTMFYLYLTTHDPNGALALNEVLGKAQLSEFELKWNLQQARWVHESHEAGQLTLFDSGLDQPTPPPIATRRVDIEALAKDIWNEFKETTVSKREVYRSLANSDVFAGEIDQALTRLKRWGWAAYETPLRLDGQIHFALSGAVGGGS